MDDCVWLLFGRPQLSGQAVTHFYGRVDDRAVTVPKTTRRAA
jgi:hypothetical protein